MNLRGFVALVAQEISEKAIPTLSYVLFDQKEVLARRHVARQGRLLEDAVFRIGSVSKTFAALAVMRLVEEGTLALDIDIAELVPGFAPTSPWGGDCS